MNLNKVKRGWCYNCGQTMWAPDSGGYTCAKCGKDLTPPEELPPRLRKVFRFQAWDDDIGLRGLTGFSPGSAAADLGCHRTMIDKLVTMGVLEKSEYNRDGFHVVIISDRSILKALENKKRTGKWTDSGKD